MHDMVNVPKLMFAGGLVTTVAEAQNALVRGNVFIERWRISVAESMLPRWVLRGVTIHYRDKSITIADDGSCILAQRGAVQLGLSDG